MKSLLIKILLLFIALIPVGEATASDIDAATQKTAINVVLKIHKYILSKKDRYPELAQASDVMVKRDPKLNLPLIDYKYVKKTEGEEGITIPYSIKLAFYPFDQKSVDGEASEVASWAYPFLNLRMVLLVKRDATKHAFRIKEVAQLAANDLFDHQQKYIPMKLFIHPKKDVYRVGDRLTFDIELRNDGDQHWKVKELGPKSLECQLNNRTWGGIKKESDIVRLKIGESLRKGFAVQMLKKPEIVSIYCTYDMAFDNVRPYAYEEIEVHK